MNAGVKTLLVFSLWFLIVLGGAKSFGDEKAVSQGSYELRFLGVKFKKDEKAGAHLGLFLFIWKGQEPTRILTTDFGPDQNLRPFPKFEVHTASGWKSTGEWCATGSSMKTIQPGQVLTFFMDMSWVERDWPERYSIKDVDQARFKISSSDGVMLSDEFTIPLVPAEGK